MDGFCIIFLPLLGLFQDFGIRSIHCLLYKCLKSVKLNDSMFCDYEISDKENMVTGKNRYINQPSCYNRIKFRGRANDLLRLKLKIGGTYYFEKRS